MFQGIADAANSVGDFLDGMARTFTDAGNADIDELRTNSERDIRNLPGRMVFGPANGPNGGFKPEFRTLEGIGAVNMMRKGQVKRLAGSDGRGQAKFVESLFGLAA